MRITTHSVSLTLKVTHFIAFLLASGAWAQISNVDVGSTSLIKQDSIVSDYINPKIDSQVVCDPISCWWQKDTSYDTLKQSVYTGYYSRMITFTLFYPTNDSFQLVFDNVNCGLCNSRSTKKYIVDSISNKVIRPGTKISTLMYYHDDSGKTYINNGNVNSVNITAINLCGHSDLHYPPNVNINPERKYSVINKTTIVPCTVYDLRGRICRVSGNLRALPRTLSHGIYLIKLNGGVGIKPYVR